MKHGTIYIIRHGMTDGNKLKSFQGGLEKSLNADGLAQVEKLIQYFQNIPLDAIYSSPMVRARQTADPLAKVKGLQVQEVPEFHEVSFGSWEGQEYDEIVKKWPQEMHLFLNKPGEFLPPNGKSFFDVQKRAWGKFEEIMAKEGNGKQIAIISHGGCIRLLLCAILGMPLNKMWSLSVGNASVTTIHNWDGRMIMVGYNDSHFL